MDNHPRCPSCKRKAVIFSPDKQIWYSEECGFSTTVKSVIVNGGVERALQIKHAHLTDVLKESEG